jgi:hypothetical protein
MNGSFGSYPDNGLARPKRRLCLCHEIHSNWPAPSRRLSKYDPRYADAIGKYMVNLVNNARCFSPRTLSRPSIDEQLFAF